MILWIKENKSFILNFYSKRNIKWILQDNTKHWELPRALPYVCTLGIWFWRALKLNQTSKTLSSDSFKIHSTLWKCKKGLVILYVHSKYRERNLNTKFSTLGLFWCQIHPVDPIKMFYGRKIGRWNFWLLHNFFHWLIPLAFGKIEKKRLFRASSGKSLGFILWCEAWKKQTGSYPHFFPWHKTKESFWWY